MSSLQIKSVEELKAFAKRFLEDSPEGAVVALSGELGAGKTTFVRAFIELLAAREKKETPRVASPSFVLHQTYTQFGRSVDHFDLYRLEDVTREGLLEIGYYEAWDRAKRTRGFLFVEWPEKVRAPGDLKADRQLSIGLTSEAAVPSARSLAWS